MSFDLRKSTAGQVVQFKMIDSTDFKTAKTGLTIANTDIKLVANDGTTQSNKNSGGATEIGSTGVYYMTLDATDTATLGKLRVDIQVAGALAWFGTFMVLPAVAWDALYAASGGAIMADLQTIKTQAVTCSGGVTVPAATLASTTNITAGTITTTTNLTNLPAITAGWLTATGIAANALNGKGDWNVGKTGYTLTAGTGLGNQTANITGNLSGSVGSVTGAVGSVTGAVGSVTGSVGSVTGNVGGNVVGSVASVTGTVSANVTQINGETSLNDGSGRLLVYVDKIYNPITETYNDGLFPSIGSLVYGAGAIGDYGAYTITDQDAWNRVTLSADISNGAGADGSIRGMSMVFANSAGVFTSSAKIIAITNSAPWVVTLDRPRPDNSSSIVSLQMLTNGGDSALSGGRIVGGSGTSWSLEGEFTAALVGQYVRMTAGNATGEKRLIIAASNFVSGTTPGYRTIDIEIDAAFTQAPTSYDVFVIDPADDITGLIGTLAGEFGARPWTAGTLDSSSFDGVYVAGIGFIQAIRLIGAAALGKCDGANVADGNFYDFAGDLAFTEKTDANGNRTAVTIA